MIRRSGDDYFEHSVALAVLMQNFDLSNQNMLIRVALAHDLPLAQNPEQVMENAPLSKDEKKMVWTMNALRRLNSDTNPIHFERIIMNFFEDEKIAFLRLGHRYLDLQNLQMYSEKTQQKIAMESLQVYSPIAEKLLLNEWKDGIDTACFQVLYPAEYRLLKQQIQDNREEDLLILKSLREKISDFMGDIDFSFKCRLKPLYSLFQKMKKYTCSFSEVSDRLALRIIVEDEDLCYQVLEKIKANFVIREDDIKDYISSPKKENGYRSLHVLLSLLENNKTIEIQIRTPEMDRVAKYGLAAHWKYKKEKYASLMDEIKSMVAKK